jgi:hypothetical protein
MAPRSDCPTFSITTAVSCACARSTASAKASASGIDSTTRPMTAVQGSVASQRMKSAGPRRNWLPLVMTLEKPRSVEFITEMAAEPDWAISAARPGFTRSDGMAV